MRVMVAVLVVAAVVVVVAAAAEERRQDVSDIWNDPLPPPGVAGRPTDCTDYLMAGVKESGVYQIYPFSCTCQKPVQVWCDMGTDGGGWTVFLNRQNTTHQLDFNRPWSEYKNGFGNPEEEYWLGNEILHIMTMGRAYTLRLDLEYTTGGSNYAVYQDVFVGYEHEGYKITVKGTTYGTSNINTCFNYLDGRSFTTLDRDHDSWNAGNCAIKQGGGWWHYNCNHFNPTNSGFNTTLEIICNGSKMYVSRLQLKLRPKICDDTFKTIHLKNHLCGCNDDPHSPIVPPA